MTLGINEYGRSTFTIWLCVLLATFGFFHNPNSPGFNIYIVFLTAVVGAVAGRAIMEDKKTQSPTTVTFTSGTQSVSKSVQPVNKTEEED